MRLNASAAENKAGLNPAFSVLPLILVPLLFSKMCGRFTLKSPGRIKFDRPRRGTLPPLLPRYNIAPSQSVLTIVHCGAEPSLSTSSVNAFKLSLS
jgi:hypothetical protein